MKKNVKLDMTQIKEALQKLSFLKSYSFLLPSVIIIIVAILLYIPTPIMNDKLQQRIQKESISKGKSLAGLSDKIVSKDQWKQYEKSNLAYLSDVEKASEWAVQTSQRELLGYGIFPAPKDTSVTIFKQFGKTFQDRLESSVKAAGGGDRPTDIELGLSGDIGRTAARSIGQISDKVRDALCLKRAKAISFYADVYDLMFYNYWSASNNMLNKQVKVFEYSGVDSAVQDCWYTQVGYWIIEDVVATIKAVNGSSSSVYDSAVKRLISFSFGLTGDSQSSAVKVLPEYVISSQDEYGDVTGQKDALVTTFTGRSSKDGIDVVYFNLSIAIDSTKMMEFMKELCSAKKHTFIGFDGQSAKKTFKHNQITILDADFQVLDRSAVEHNYYRYGDAAVVEFVLGCEYVFNRKGYSDVKPVSIKKLLNEEIEIENLKDEPLDQDEDSNRAKM